MPPRRQPRAATHGVDGADLAELQRDHDDLRRQVELLTRRMVAFVRMRRHDADVTVPDVNPFGGSRIRSHERHSQRWDRGFKSFAQDSSVLAPVTHSNNRWRAGTNYFTQSANSFLQSCTLVGTDEVEVEGDITDIDENVEDDSEICFPIFDEYDDNASPIAVRDDSELYSPIFDEYDDEYSSCDVEELLEDNFDNQICANDEDSELIPPVFDDYGPFVALEATYCFPIDVLNNTVEFVVDKLEDYQLPKGRMVEKLGFEGSDISKLTYFEDFDIFVVCTVDVSRVHWVDQSKGGWVLRTLRIRGRILSNKGRMMWGKFELIRTLEMGKHRTFRKRLDEENAFGKRDYVTK